MAATRVVSEVIGAFEAVELVAVLVFFLLVISTEIPHRKPGRKRARRAQAAVP
jgi:hypothetical protein